VPLSSIIPLLGKLECCDPICKILQVIEGAGIPDGIIARGAEQK